MNLKALITSLVLGSSSMAAADASFSAKGSVTVSLGGTTHSHTHAQAPVYRPAPSRPVVVADPDCHDPAPVYQPVRPIPTQPVWQAPYYQITNSYVANSGSTYQGRIGSSTITAVPQGHWQRNWNGNGWVYVKPQAQTQVWFQLTEATRIDSNRQFIKVGTDKGLFNKLQLQALGNGSSRIAQVLVEYADNRGQASQVFKLNNTMIHRGNQSITLDLDGEHRSIKRIVVYGATDQGSAYKLMAM